MDMLDFHIFKISSVTVNLKTNLEPLSLSDTESNYFII